MEEPVKNALAKWFIKAHGFKIGEVALPKIFFQKLDIPQEKQQDAGMSSFYGAMIDSEYLEKGCSYDKLPEVYIIYVSERDLWKSGYTVYRVHSIYQGTDIPYEDGRDILYVNAEVDDHTEVADLMNYFKKADPDDMSQGELSRRVHYLKCEEGGYEEMCEISEKIYREGMEEGIEKGKEKGKDMGFREEVRVYRELGLSREEILDKLCQRFSLLPKNAEKYLQ